MKTSYRFIDPPLEVIVGDATEMVLECTGEPSPHDWVGIYPSSVPTVPGVSHGRWKYISTFSETNDIAQEQVAMAPKERSSDKHNRVLKFDPSFLPNHAGAFEVRVHLANQYGKPVAAAPLHILDGPISPYGRLILLILIVITTACFQHYLNAKGTCTFLDPHVYTTDVIDDAFIRVTSDLNKRLIANPVLAEAYQAICSLLIDTALLALLYLGTTRRSSVRPFLSILIFFTFRFIAQIAAVIPCSPGFLWPVGKLFGYEIPTVFVDYEPTNDMFFSGHAGTTFIIGLEFFELDYHRLAWFQMTFALPVISVWVVTARAHRGIDVWAGILAAVASCSIAKELAVTLDSELQVSRRIRRAAKVLRERKQVDKKK